MYCESDFLALRGGYGIQIYNNSSYARTQQSLELHINYNLH